MKFDIYGRYQLVVERENDDWIVYRSGLGTRLRDPAVVIPASVAAEDIATYLDDLFHESASPGQTIREVP
jgi:hypothetical protein